MMESSFTILRVRGIPIGAHWSWLLVFALVVWSLGTALFPATYPGLDGATYLVMAAVAALVFFASVLAHELGHALRALAEGERIDGITLWLFGGVARLRGLPNSPGAEFRIAAAGPAVTVVLVVAFWAVEAAAGAFGWPDAVEGLFDYLTRINLLVLGFNLVPALPLDGGRVLRAWLWRRQRSFPAATRSAARAGQAFGGMLAIIGLLGFLTGGGVGGLWLIFLGWFLIQAAQAEAAMALTRQALGGLRVAEVMTPQPAVVPPDRTVAAFIEAAAGNRRFTSYPVVDAQGRFVGVMSLSAAAAVPVGERERRLVGEVMTRAEGVPTVEADLPAADALALLGADGKRAAVVDDGRLVGVISSADMVRELQLAQARGLPPEPGARGPGLLVWLVLALVLLGAAAAIYQPPFVVVAPGEAVDVAGDITITGAPVDQLNGRYLLTSVRLRRSNGLGTLVAALRPDREVVRAGAVIPQGVDPDEFIGAQREAFTESRRLAAAAAARAVGLPVTVTGSGARVARVLPDSPAAEGLRAGDAIVAVDGQPVSDAGDLRELLQASPAGERVRLTVERDGRRLTVALRTRQLPALAGGTGIGVQVETRDLQVQLPFEVRFAERPDVAGPSAGLAYALAIADLLDQGDYARGRAVAATGTIEADGDVGLVGGVEQKAIAAERAGAALFLVPSAEVDQAREADIRVQGVAELEQALALLSTAG
jgi:PDZ domain-containing secreted protein/Zn-dependent protease/CBS domain-containing protein